MSDLPSILTVRECAEYLRLSDKTVRKMIWEGKIRPLRLRGAIRIRRDDLERAINPSYRNGYSSGSKNVPSSSTSSYERFLQNLDNKRNRVDGKQVASNH